jgi:hypothetical protein
MVVHPCNHSFLRQKDCEFEASLGYIARPSIKKTKTTTTTKINEKNQTKTKKIFVSILGNDYKPKNHSETVKVRTDCQTFIFYRFFIQIHRKALESL